MNSKFSLIEAQVINQALKNVALETGIVLQRSAFSPNIKDRLDFSSAIMDQDGRLIAQAEHIPVHLGAMPKGVQAIIEYFGKENILDGDIYIANNPYLGGTHLPDIAVIKPIFYDDKLVGYIANRCHHADVGGVVPGSMPSGKYTLEEEGYVIDPTIFERNGILNQEWFNDFLSNIRVPEERKGDIQAQLASTKIGEKKFHSLLQKYSLDRVQQVIDFLNERSKNASLELIKQIPENQVFSFTDYMDNDGVKDEPINITAEVERKGDKLVVDYSKTDSQVEGNINATYAVTLSATYYILRCLISREYATNYGLYEPLDVITKKGSLIDPLPPAGVAAGNVETSQRITDVMLGVFSKLFPDDVPAASSGTMNNTIIGGLDSVGKEFTYYETIAGGIGAGKNYSPPNAKHSHMTNTRNTSIEVLERYYPLRVEEYSIISNTGGIGKWSGSNGVRRSIQLLAKEGVLSIQSERRKYAPFGLFGGKNGAKGKNLLKTSDKIMQLPSKITKKIKRGDIVVIETPGGGGYGEK
ncbi:MAG: hydantoinase B/oxoprolinase family protein [Candidatus Heimdallarchaeota archaeon]|nr:hydantoinase B/oxoprolinase family protein [Candidatus Heimdallarchaeota archaeon]MCK4876091.1 hydantoinase B/oxoprolinase family protein [Candidatus Heimdallarchaeota archaeon]